MSQKSKKVFNINNNFITAGGVLMAKIVKKNGIEKLYVLLVNYKDKKYSERFDDFGGKAINSDQTIIDTICRKVDDESNCQIDKNELLKKINCDNKLCFCDTKSKYALYLALNIGEWYPDTSIFGDVQENMRWPRSVEWYEFNTIKDKLSYRLKSNKNFMKYMKNLSSGLEKKQEDDFSTATEISISCNLPNKKKLKKSNESNKRIRNIQRVNITMDNITMNNIDNKKIRITYYSQNSTINLDTPHVERIEQTIEKMDDKNLIDYNLVDYNSQPKNCFGYKNWLDDDKL